MARLPMLDGDDLIPDRFVPVRLSTAGLNATLKAPTRQALAAAILPRMSRPESDRQALYTGTTPVWTFNAASQIASSVLRQPKRATVGGATAVDLTNDPNFRYLNTTSLAYGTVFPDFSFVKPPLLTGGSAQSAFFTPRVSFWYDGRYLEVYAKALATTFAPRLRIDGRLVTADQATATSGLTAGSLYYHKLDLGSAAMRLIELDINPQNATFGGIACEPTASISRGPLPNLRIAGLTDSIGAGSGDYSRLTSWLGLVTELLGSDVSCWNAGIGGTGYGVSSGVSDFITRVSDVVAAAPDILFVQGEQNDSAQSGAQIQTLATTLLTTLRAQLPNTLIFVVGSYPQTNQPNNVLLLKMQHEAGLRAATAAVEGCYFISWIDPTGVAGTAQAWASSTLYRLGDVVLNPATGMPSTCTTGHTSTGSYDASKFRTTSVFFGSGRVGSTTGDGNADVMFQSDGVHPTNAGSQVLARATQYQMRAHLRAIAATLGLTGVVH